jgi:hypothetical protein
VHLVLGSTKFATEERMKSKSHRLLVPFVFLIAVGLSGCKRKKLPPTSTTCEAVSAKFANFLVEKGTGKYPPDKLEELRGNATRLLGEICHEDDWAPSVIKCLADAADSDTVGACPLPADSIAKLNSQLPKMVIPR